MCRPLFACFFILAVSGCVQDPDTIETAGSEQSSSPSRNAYGTFNNATALPYDGIPEGFVPPTGPATQALVEYINPTTGQTWTAPTGGYTVPDGWVERIILEATNE